MNTLLNSINKDISLNDEEETNFYTLKNERIHNKIAEIDKDIVRIILAYKKCLYKQNKKMNIKNIVIDSDDNNLYYLKLNDNYFMGLNFDRVCGDTYRCCVPSIGFYRKENKDIATKKLFKDKIEHKEIITLLYEFTYTDNSINDCYYGLLINQYLNNYNFLFTEEFKSILLLLTLELQSEYIRLKEYYSKIRLERIERLENINNEQLAIDKLQSSMIEINAIVKEVEGELYE
jgi:hypothetical protein